uniref:NB-ARC domain-containing protein n=1 Tax=Oryza glumipatula TaxID=40148 RepID=A0A0E0BS32_9ORYZ
MAEAIFSAIVGDVIGRVISLVVSNFNGDHSTEVKLQRICRMLIKIHSVVEEAKGRQITNHGTLEWLSELIDGAYQGRYLLDTIGCGEPDLDDKNRDEVDPKPFSLSKFNPAKRVRVAAFTVRNILSRHDIGVDEIDRVVESLQSMCGDLKEFMMLLQACQPIHRPLATNIFIEGQMFGRHVEKEMIINFLLHEDDLPRGKLGVLPILGDIGVGKTTLVQHACDDARVRSHFTTILLFNFSHTYKMEMCEPKPVLRPKHVIGDIGNSDDPLHELEQSFFNKRFLIVFEDVDIHKKNMLEELLKSLNCGKQGSKIIVTTSNKHVTTIGTVQPIKLKFLPCPEYWFFFKARAFAGTDVQENPRLVAAGKSIAAKLNGSFFGAKIIGAILKENPDPKFWCTVLQRDIGGLSLLGDGLGYIADLVEILLPSRLSVKEVFVSKNPLSSETELARLQGLCLPCPSSAPLATHSSELSLAKATSYERVLLCKAVLPFYSLYYTAKCAVDSENCYSKFSVV